MRQEVGPPLQEPVLDPVEAPVLVEDPREEGDWFQRLPEEFKEDLRERWRNQDDRARRQDARRRRTTLRYLGEGVVVFVLAERLYFGYGWSGFWIALMVGLLVGSVAAQFRVGSYRYGSLGIAGYLVFWSLTGWFSFFAMVWCLGWCQVLGITHVLQRFDGTER